MSDNETLTVAASPNGDLRTYPDYKAAHARPQAGKLGVVLGALAVICISVVLSVVATIFVISFAESGVLLPQYAQYNQPAKTSQLGFCVSDHGSHVHVWTALSVGYCYRGHYIKVQPQVVRP